MNPQDIAHKQIYDRVLEMTIPIQFTGPNVRPKIRQHKMNIFRRILKGGQQMAKEASGKLDVPIWEKYSLTVNEASAYFHIGDKKLREIIADDPDADYILRVGNRNMIRRKKFEAFLDRQEAV